ncbi:MAG: DUF3658 domain-containing protein [Bacteroidota bacterium]
MIHIVFQHADVDALQKSFELDESLKGDIVEIKDDYAVGPLYNLYIGEGMEQRRQWWRDVLAGGDNDGHVETGLVDDSKTVAELVGTMRRNPEEKIWIWAAQNKHDVSGYYWLLNYMKEFQGRVFILYMNNLPFINEKGHIFYPLNLFEIAPREFLKARKLAREITLSEFEVDPDEWTKLSNENKGVRLLEGGKKLGQADYDYFDSELKKFITPDWQKASRIIHHFLSKAKVTTGDMYLLWRLKTMIAQDMFDVQGKVANMKDFEIKTKA